MGNEARPAWVELKGTRFVDPKFLDKCGLRKPWHRYLNSIVSLEDVKDDEIVWKKKVSKKREVPNRKSRVHPIPNVILRHKIGLYSL